MTHPDKAAVRNGFRSWSRVLPTQEDPSAPPPNSGFRRLRQLDAYPALVAVTYVGVGLLWLLLAHGPLLGASLAGTGLSTHVLMILASGGLLYGLLRFHLKTARRATLAQDLRLAEFIEMSTDVAFAKDREGRYLLLNSAGARLAGRRLTECLGQDDHALFPTQIAARLAEADRQVMANGHLLSDEHTFDIDGERRTLQWTQWPDRDADGYIIGVLGIARDTTTRKQDREQSRQTHGERETQTRGHTAEAVTTNQTLERRITADSHAEIVLHDSEECFRQLAEHIREVFWVYGIVEKRLLYLSPAYEEIWGQTAHTLQERPLGWLEAVHADDRPRIRAAHLTKLELGLFDEEYRIVRPDGAIRWIRDRGFPIHDATGHVYRIVGLAEDITARKLAEGQLRRQQMALAKMSRLSLAVELASHLAHELNQPLAAIIAYTQACLTLLRGDTTNFHALTDTLNEIVNQGWRAGGIIRHLRELVERHPAVQSTIDLNTLIRAVADYMQLEFRQAGIVARLELAEPLPAILADDIRLQLVMLYLVRNAIEAMQDSDDEPRELLMRTTTLDTGAVLVTIRDRGHGFDPQTTQRLFQPFFSTKPGGMGLGLSVSRSLIESQGGRLWATSNSDRGVSFHFTLPAHTHKRWPPISA